MSLQQNKDITVRFWEQVFNQRKLDLVEGMFAEDYVYRGAAGQEVRGKEGLKQFLGSYFAAFPDMHAEIEDVFGEGDKVFSRTMCRGTHRGTLMGMPATGKEIAIRVLCSDRFAGGKIAESVELADLFGMMQQLGAASPR